MARAARLRLPGVAGEDDARNLSLPARASGSHRRVLRARTHLGSVALLGRQDEGEQLLQRSHRKASAALNAARDYAQGDQPNQLLAELSASSSGLPALSCLPSNITGAAVVSAVFWYSYQVLCARF